MTSACTYTYEIGYNPSLGVVTRADARKKGVQEFLSTDPLTSYYPMLTPYQFASNSPIANIDLDGLEAADAKDYDDSDSRSFLELVSSGEFRQAAQQMFDGLTLPESDIDLTESLKSLFVVEEKAEAAENHMYETADDLLETTQDAGDDVALAAAATTVVSGGTSSPVSVPVGAGGKAVSTSAGVLRVGLEWSRDGSPGEATSDFFWKFVTGKASKFIKGKLVPEGFFEEGTTKEVAKQGESVFDAIFKLNTKAATTILNETDKQEETESNTSGGT